MIPRMQQVSAREIAVSGIRAQRARMNVIANNIANAFTTRMPNGAPFQRQLVILRGEEFRHGGATDRLGVQVKRLERDSAPFRRVYQPEHPDAGPDGYVAYPNVSLSVEMVDLVSAQRAYEANVAVIASHSRMMQRAQQMLDAG